MSIAVSAQGLSKKYGQLEALKGLSFQIKEGECAGLLGPNGAGKSTFLKIITGQLQPSSGSVRVFGADPCKNPKKAHGFMGYVPDHQSVYDDLSVEHNIELFREIYREPKARTAEIIQRTGLQDKRKAKAKTLSRGLKQRLLLARTLVHAPKALFLDEPAAGLDPSSADFIRQILEELKQEGATIILCAHLMSFAERLCDHIILLDKGEKKEDGTLAELKKKYGAPNAQVKFLKEKRERTALIPLKGAFIEELARIQKEGEIISIHTQEASLENIFIRLARGGK